MLRRWQGEGSREAEKRGGAEVERVEGGGEQKMGGGWREGASMEGKGHREGGRDGGQRWRPRVSPHTASSNTVIALLVEGGNASHFHSQDQTVIFLEAFLKYHVWPQ